MGRIYGCECAWEVLAEAGRPSWQWACIDLRARLQYTIHVRLDCELGSMRERLGTGRPTAMAMLQEQDNSGYRMNRHTLFAVLLVLFGIGMLKFVQGHVKSMRLGIAGAWAYIAMGVVNIATATIFPQDAWGSEPTFFGEMHIILHGVISILSMLSILLIGIWSYRSGVFPKFRTFSFGTIVAVMLTAGMLVASLGSPMMGLFERLVALVGFQWTFALAALISTRE